VGLFVDIPKPSPWPRPKPDETERIQKLMSYAQERDPIGDKIHTIFACLFMFSLPLATAPASISMAALSVYSLMRLPSTWRGLTLIGNSKVLWAMLAWAGWTVLSITWSSDPEQGLDHAEAMWALGLFFVLPPVLHNWRFLLGAFLLGVAVQNGVQIMQLTKALQMGRIYVRPSGFNGHAGNSSIFMAVAFVVWLAILMFGNRFRWYTLVGAALALFGVVLARGFGVWIGLAFGSLLLCCIKIHQDKPSLKKVLISSIAIALVVVFSGYLVKPSLLRKIKEVTNSIERYSEGEIQTGNEKRLVWWETELKASVKSPETFLFGHGAGSTTTVRFGTKKRDKKLVTSHPHSVYAQTLYEGGSIGLALLLMWFSMVVIFFLRGPKLFLIAGISIQLLWLVVGVFEGTLNFGLTLALYCSLAVFSHTTLTNVRG
jgi:O-antigen ligase